MSSAPPLHALRGLLRRLKTPPLAADLAARKTATAGPPPRQSATAKYVLERYRACAKETDSAKLLKLRKTAANSLTLLENLAERQALYELDAGAEVQLSPQEMTRRAAARAGLQPPDLQTDFSKPL